MTARATELTELPKSRPSSIKGLLGAIPVIACLSASPTHAASFSQSGATAAISGAIDDGDDFRLNAFLRRPEAAQIKVIYLNSPGGYVYAAYKMSEAIRAARLSTAVDASHAICASACTALFVAGVQRYYLNAQSLADGSRQGRGLGFHSASDWNGGAMHANRESSQVGNGMLAYVYREMGASGASDLVKRADYTGVYWVSGQTALSLNVATSLGRP
jgi:hypothetical protein